MTGNNRRGIILQDRDRRLLRELAIMRVIDREQAKLAAGFKSTTRANTRLLALTRAGLLRRFFLGTVGGARKALYAMSPKAAELMGIPYRGPRRGTDQTLIADFFVLHQMQINELYALLKFRLVLASDKKLVRWESFYEPIDQRKSLIPDGYAEIATAGKTISCFLEVDLGNESRAVWKAKVEAYLQLAVSGTFQETFHQQQFRVLAVANSERRVQSLRVATAVVTEKIFWFATFEAIRREGLWAAIWQRPTGGERQSLL